MAATGLLTGILGGAAGAASGGGGGTSPTANVQGGRGSGGSTGYGYSGGTVDVSTPITTTQGGIGAQSFNFGGNPNATKWGMWAALAVGGVALFLVLRK